MNKETDLQKPIRGKLHCADENADKRPYESLPLLDTRSSNSLYSLAGATPHIVDVTHVVMQHVQ